MDFAAGQSGVACLSDELLSDFAAGRLPDPALEEQLADHLASCDSCASRLQSLPGDPLLELLCAADPLQPLVESGRLPLDHSLLSTTSVLKVDSKRVEPRKRSAPQVNEELPVKIGDYFVIRKLGRGGFGDVYLARDPLHERLVAVKVPRSDRFLTRDSRAAFLREARTIAELDHPHIVSLYDCCELSDGRCIVVMEYIEGTTLKELMQKERIDHARAVEIVAQIADALDYAHQRNIWHRDVKPANILLDQEGQPYLTDFGLALHEEQQQQLGEELAGTAPYMSPEQILGRANQLDGRSDIWSLGVIFYELLTRHRPFQGSTYEELVQEIPNRTPKAPRFYDPAIGQKDELACMKCLERDPADRFATAAEFARELRRQPVRTSSRRKVLALSAAAVAAAAVGVASWRLLIPEPKRELRRLKMQLKPLAWPTLKPTDFYKSRPDSGVAIQSSASRSCFETHWPATNHYRFRASGEFQDDVGFAGLALGIDETAQTPQRYRVMVVYIDKDFHGSRETWLTVETAEIAMNGHSRMAFSPGLQLAQAKVDDKLLYSFKLEIEVHERITRVLYNDRRLPEVEAKLADHKIASGTSCGIMATGHIVFHSLICEEFDNE
jgi:serine/threonine protein kinase